MGLREIGERLGHSGHEIEHVINCLVGEQWLDTVDDLHDLVEDRHWQEWDFPEQVVVEIKLALSENQGNFGQAVSSFFAWSSCLTGRKKRNSRPADSEGH